MIQQFDRRKKDDSVRIRMDITVDLPVEMANELERLGIYEFEQCTFDEDSRRMKARVTTKMYRKGA